jgi:hemerythrin-like metal-binding protein
LNRSTGTAKAPEWSPDYSVRIAEIDREHQEWFAMLGRLHNALLEGKGAAILGPLVAEMTQYAVRHIDHEEKLMKETGYPGSKVHVLQHDELRREVATFEERFKRGETTMTIELTLFVGAWLKQHINTSDKRLGDFINERTKGGRAVPPHGPKAGSAAGIRRPN